MNPHFKKVPKRCAPTLFNKNSNDMHINVVALRLSGQLYAINVFENYVNQNMFVGSFHISLFFLQAKFGSFQNNAKIILKKVQNKLCVAK